MISGILPLLIIFAAMYSVSRALTGRKRGGVSTIRHTFQYAVTFALLCLTASGLAGLLTQLVTRSSVLLSDQSALARYLSFTVVAGPLLVIMLLWLRRGIARTPDDVRSPTFGLFLTLTTATTLILSSSAAADVIHSFLPHSNQVATLNESWPRLLVWGAFCFGTWRVGSRLAAPDAARATALLSSFIALVYVIVGLVGAIDAAVGMTLGKQTLVNSADSGVWVNIGTLAVGAFAWWFYWVRTALKQSRDGLWLAYVLLAGVGASFVMLVSAASVIVYRVLVWFIGTPGSGSSSAYFGALSLPIAFVITGQLLWWYHRGVIAGDGARSEVRRMYEYIISAISGIASAVGLAIMIVSGIEAVTKGNLLVGSGAMNTLLAAATLIVVGGSVWGFFWRRIQQVAHTDHDEYSSITRRIYLYVLFGVGGVTAIVCLLIAVYMLFNDLIAGNLSAVTLSDLRYAIGVLVSTGIIAGYHWTVFRHERGVEVRKFAQSKTVVLVGKLDRDAAKAVAERTGARVQLWKRTDNPDLGWDIDAVVHLVESVAGSELLIVSDPSGAFAIPIDRD